MATLRRWVRDTADRHPTSASTSHLAMGGAPDRIYYDQGERHRSSPAAAEQTYHLHPLWFPLPSRSWSKRSLYERTFDIPVLSFTLTVVTFVYFSAR